MRVSAVAHAALAQKPLPFLVRAIVPTSHLPQCSHSALVQRCAPGRCSGGSASSRLSGIADPGLTPDRRKKVGNVPKSGFVGMTPHELVQRSNVEADCLVGSRH